MSTQTRLIDELDALHAHYAGAVTAAADAGDVNLALELAADYDRDAIMLMAEREGRHDLLAHFGLDSNGDRLVLQRDTPLRRLARSIARLRVA
ncbi:hypothetical protein [Nocardioides currus]|uniref:Uncharacterized protein n=1 Tax=Nocardioides currus TaxID=2133958 RepID=A0A2R7YSK9_9ACTN|nr:hypothetical protein [Nocardioides currus]PUA79398.1 hypothetical protein C7S10_18645 [Nocardioides currus]